MATGKRPPSAIPGARRKRPAPTIDLTATEVAAEPARCAGASPSRRKAEASPQAEAPPAPPHVPPPRAARAPLPSRRRPSGIAWLPPDFPWPAAVAGALAAAAVLLVFLSIWLIVPRGGDAVATLTPRLAFDRNAIARSGGAARSRRASIRRRSTRCRRGSPSWKARSARHGRWRPIRTCWAASARWKALVKPLSDSIVALARRADDTDAAFRNVRGRIDTAAAAVAELQNAARASSGDHGEIAKLADRIAALEKTDRAVADQLAKNAAAAANDRPVRFALAASALRAAVERGEPFAAELAAVKPLAADAAGAGGDRAVRGVRRAERRDAGPRAARGCSRDAARRRRPRRATAAFSTACRPTPRSWCASARSSERRRRRRRDPVAHRGQAPRTRTSPARSPSSPSCRPRCARRRSPGSPRRRRAARRSRRAAGFAADARRRAQDNPIGRSRDDPRHPLSRAGRPDRARRGLARRPSGRRRDHLAGLAHRDLGDGDGGGDRGRRRGRAAAVVADPHHPALARPDRDVPQPPPRRARLSRDLARPDRGRRRRRARGAQVPPTRPSGSRPASRWRLLLNAQCAQLAGDRAAAEFAFRAMAERDDTKLLGLRGLYVEAQRRDGRARRRAATPKRRRRPRRRSPGPGRRCWNSAARAGDWAGALAALDRNSRYGLIDKRGLPAPARGAAHRARARRRGGRPRPRPCAGARSGEACADAGAGGRSRGAAARRSAASCASASRIIEKAWKANPHPDLADTYAHLRSGDSARERLARVQSLAQKAPGHVESALAVARAALDAQEFAAARAALQAAAQGADPARRRR